VKRYRVERADATRAVSVHLQGEGEGCGPACAVFVFSSVAGASLLSGRPVAGFADAMLIAMAVGVPVVLSLLTLSLASQSIRVGADGLWVGRTFRRRFIPIVDLERVEEGCEFESDGVTAIPYECRRLILHRRRGLSPIKLPRVLESETMELAERIRGLIERAREGRARATSALERGGRTIEAWTRDLRALVRPAGFREASVPQDDLEQMLEDPTASFEQRLGAAIALGGKGAAEAEQKIRAAAQASAHPKLRIALESLASGADAAKEVEAVLEAEAAEAEESARAPSGSLVLP
jgi:hypothetical protein